MLTFGDLSSSLAVAEQMMRESGGGREGGGRRGRRGRRRWGGGGREGRESGRERARPEKAKMAGAGRCSPPNDYPPTNPFFPPTHTPNRHRTMLWPRDKFDVAFSKMKEDAVEAGGCTVLIFVAPSCDALCALRILIELFKAEEVSYKIKPVSSYDDLYHSYEELVKESDSWRSIVMINLGASIPLSENFALGDDVTCYVMDSHRPIDLYNVHSDAQYVVFDDGQTAAEDIPSDGDLDLDSDGEKEDEALIAEGSDEGEDGDEDEEDDEEDDEDEEDRMRDLDDPEDDDAVDDGDEDDEDFAIGSGAGADAVLRVGSMGVERGGGRGEATGGGRERPRKSGRDSRALPPPPHTHTLSETPPRAQAPEAPVTGQGVSGRRRGRCAATPRCQGASERGTVWGQRRRG